MAKQAQLDTAAQCNALLEDIKGKKFSPVYLLMGEEPYYSDLLIDAIVENALEPSERDFNQTIVYAQDITTEEIVSACRRYPMFAPRQLIVVKEAQQLTKLDVLEHYLEQPVPETVLVLGFTNKTVDKRTNFYKKAKANAVVFESTAVTEWTVGKWILNYVTQKGYTITPDSAEIMGEYTGTSLRKIVLEIDKLFKSLPVGVKEISEDCIKENIGLSKEFSAFELCRALVFKKYDQAYKIAHFFGENPKKYPLVLTLGAMFFFFSRLLKCNAYYEQDKGLIENAVRKAGVFAPMQIKEYSIGVRTFPLKKTMHIIAIIKEYDYMSKSGNSGTASEGALLLEIVSKINRLGQA